LTKEKEKFKQLEQKIKDAEYLFDTKITSVENKYQEEIKRLKGENN
jgi:hypothetical protein